MKKGLLFILILKSLSTFSQIKEVEIKLNDTVSIRMIEEKFNPSKHTIKYSANELVSLIDDKLVHGTDAVLPVHKFKKAEVIIKGNKIPLSTEGMYDPRLDLRRSEEFYFYQTYSGYILRGVFSVGAGVYGVEWQIINGVSFLTMITSDLAILDVFISKEDRSFDSEE